MCAAGFAVQSGNAHAGCADIVSYMAINISIVLVTQCKLQFCPNSDRLAHNIARLGYSYIRDYIMDRRT